MSYIYIIYHWQPDISCCLICMAFLELLLVHETTKWYGWKGLWRAPKPKRLSKTNINHLHLPSRNQTRQHTRTHTHIPPFIDAAVSHSDPNVSGMSQKCSLSVSASAMASESVELRDWDVEWNTKRRRTGWMGWMGWLQNWFPPSFWILESQGSQLNHANHRCAAKKDGGISCYFILACGPKNWQ